MISLVYDPASDVLYVKVDGSKILSSRSSENDDNFILNMDGCGSVVGVQWVFPHRTPKHPEWDNLPEGLRNIIDDWFVSQDRFRPWTTLQIQIAKLF